MNNENLQQQTALARNTRMASFMFLILFTIGACDLFDGDDDEQRDNVVEFPLVEIPEGYVLEKVADGLERPTSIAWDDEGNLYTLEAGNDFLPEPETPMRIVKIEKDGSRTNVIDLGGKGIKPAIVGLVWHDGFFYFTHRAEDGTGAVSRADKGGSVELLFKGIADSPAEHQINDIRVGPDGLMYVAVGVAGNSGVMDPSVAPFVERNPDVHSTPCQDIVLLGKNFKTEDFRTADEGDSVLTGAYVPFGTETQVGQVITGVTLCGGSILKFDPADAMGTMQTHAWGFRNIIGLTWDSQGNMYAAENGYDIRGARPVNDKIDASLRIHEGMWYGVPDFSVGREPLTSDEFEAPDSLTAMTFVNGEPVGKDLGFIIDHAASGLTPPDPSVVIARHDINSSPSMIDVAPESWEGWRDHAFIAEWGDLAPPTNPLRGEEATGSRIMRVDPATGDLTAFASNNGGGPASLLGEEGKGLERPFDIQFGPDGAMYIVDFGVVNIDMTKMPPYAYKRGTGVIWKISKTD
jgi:glucose/arabinose dehydrogenase